VFRWVASRVFVEESSDRLNRIAEISGHDLADTETRLNLHLATRAWRLRGGRGGESGARHRPDDRHA
jgi:hypothetical protein